MVSFYLPCNIPSPPHSLFFLCRSLILTLFLNMPLCLSVYASVSICLCLCIYLFMSLCLNFLFCLLTFVIRTYYLRSSALYKVFMSSSISLYSFLLSIPSLFLYVMFLFSSKSIFASLTLTLYLCFCITFVALIFYIFVSFVLKTVYP